MARTPSIGSDVLVRLALLPGMEPEDEPKSAEDVMRLKMALNDPAMLQEMLEKGDPALMRNRAEQNDQVKTLNVDQLTARIYLYPRVRPAKVSFVDRTDGKGGDFVNLDVFTPGSPVLQSAIGKIPQYAQQHFRLERVRFMTREPEDGHDQNVAFWAPEEDDEAPLRKSEVKKSRD